MVNALMDVLFAFKVSTDGSVGRNIAVRIRPGVLVSGAQLHLHWTTIDDHEIRTEIEQIVDMDSRKLVVASTSAKLNDASVELSWREEAAWQSIDVRAPRRAVEKHVNPQAYDSRVRIHMRLHENQTIPTSGAAVSVRLESLQGFPTAERVNDFETADFEVS